MNFMKSKAGFTLVELIVVIAILGILAGIAVPAYNGYIKKAESAADTQVLSAAYTAASSACVTDGAVSSVAVALDSGATTVDKITVVAGEKTHVFDYTAKSGETAASWKCTGTACTSGCSAVSDFSMYIGLDQLKLTKAYTWTQGAWSK